MWIRRRRIAPTSVSIADRRSRSARQPPAGIHSHRKMWAHRAETKKKRCQNQVLKQRIFICRKMYSDNMFSRWWWEVDSTAAHRAETKKKRCQNQVLKQRIFICRKMYSDNMFSRWWWEVDSTAAHRADEREHRRPQVEKRKATTSRNTLPSQDVGASR